MNLADMISHQARRRPGHPAIVSGDAVIPYGELDTLVRGGAAWLVDQGVRPGDVVGLALADTADHLIAHYAVARMGGIILPIDWRWTVDERRRIAEFFGATRRVVRPRPPKAGINSPPGASRSACGALRHGTNRSGGELFFGGTDQYQGPFG